MTATLVTPALMRQYLTQLAIAGTDSALDATLEQICQRAESTVNLDLGFTFAAYPATATAATAYGNGTPWLMLPAHQAGSVTTVALESTTPLTAQAITGWAEEPDGSLYITAVPPYYGGGWYRNRYTVTAKWGYGPAPQAVTEVALELAINIWRERDKGMFSDVIGVEGGNAVAVGYAHAWTNRQKAILNKVKQQYRGLVVA